MLDRLPPELLLPIIRLVAPLDVGGTWSDRPRRRTLRALCLVSKQLCAIAQPLLPEVFAARGSEAVEVLKKRRNGRPIGEQVKRLLVAASTNEPDSGNWAAEVYRACPSVVDLRLRGPRMVNLKLVATSCPGLEYLSIRFSALLLPSMPIFPALVHLSIDDLHIVPTALEKVLTPASLPSLRSLGLGLCRELNGNTFLPSVSPALAHRLESIVVSNHLEDGLTALSPFSTILGVLNSIRHLCNYLDNSPPPFPITHLHVHGVESLPVNLLPRFLAFLDHCPSLRLLELFTLTRPHKLRPGPRKDAIDAFVNECTRRGIGILWSEPVDLGANMLVSPEFAEWLEEERERLAA
ncbi:hypothetical protein JCM8097_004019 [Rhodosporidiobolus ruineniae]